MLSWFAVLVSVLGFTLPLIAAAEPPSGAPQDVTATTCSSTTVYVTWSDVLTDQRNGVLQEYEIKYEQYTFTEIPQSGSISVLAELEDAVTVEHLEEYVEYSFSIRASNEDGYGPFSTPVNVTTYQDVPTSPPMSVTVSASVPSQLMVTWGRPSEIDINGVLKFYSLRYHRINFNDFDLTAINASQDSIILTGLYNYTLYEVLIAATTINGTGPFISHTIQTSENVPQSPPQNVTANSITPYTVDMEWRPPNESEWNGILRGYQIRYAETTFTSTTTSQPQLRAWMEIYISSANQTNYTISQLHSSTSYCIQVTAVTTVGIGPYSQPLYVSTLENDSNNNSTNSGSGEFNDTSSMNETESTQESGKSAVFIAVVSVVCTVVMAILVGVTTLLIITAVLRRRRFQKSRSLVHYFTTTVDHHDNPRDTHNSQNEVTSIEDNTLFINPSATTFELSTNRAYNIGNNPLPSLPNEHHQFTPTISSSTVFSGDEENDTSSLVNNPQYGRFSDNGRGVANVIGGVVNMGVVSLEVTESDYDYPATFRAPIVDNNTGDTYSTVVTTSTLNDDDDPPYATVT